MELQMANSAGSINLAESAFAKDYNEALVHQVVTAYLAGARQGSKAQKTRSDVSGGGAKPWRQKGTGRARAGTIRSPIWRGGGVTFAARPRDYSQKINRKMYRGAMQSIMSELIRQARLVVVDKFEVASPKTKELHGTLKNMEMLDVLIVTENANDNLYYAAKNIPHVGVTDVIGLNPVDLLSYNKILMTAEAIKKIEEQLA